MPAAARSPRPGWLLRAAAAVAVALALVACGPAAAPSATSSGTPGPGLGVFPRLPTGDLPVDVTASLQTILDDIDAPGIAAAVIVADCGTWAGAAGTAGAAPLDPTAQFAIGSVTKRSPRRRCFGSWNRGPSISIGPSPSTSASTTSRRTVRQVLGMRSGIGDPQAASDTCQADLAAPISLADLRKVPLGNPYFEPGAGFRYTSANYDLAGILIEEVTDLALASVLRSGVLSALGLERLIYQDAERPTPPLAAPFVILPRP